MKKKERNDKRRVILLRFLSRKLGVVAKDERASHDTNHELHLHTTHELASHTFLNKTYTNAVRGIRTAM